MGDVADSVGAGRVDGEQERASVLVVGGGVLGEGLARVLSGHGVAAVCADGDVDAVVRTSDASVVVLAGAVTPGQRRALRDRGVRVVLCGDEPVGPGDADVVRVALDSDPRSLVRAVTGEPAPRRGVPRLRGDGPRPALPSGLTEREVEVLRQLMAGRSTTAMAQHLDISAHTVRTHVQNILGKLGVSTRLQAATIGHRLAIPPAGSASVPSPGSPGTDRDDTRVTA